MKKNAFDPVRARIWALTGLMGLCLVAFAGVMYYTQILHGEETGPSPWPAMPPVKRWKRPGALSPTATERCWCPTG